jgi:hypothetical protein
MADLQYYLELVKEQVRAKAADLLRECNIPVYTEVLETENILTLLETNFLKWPPRDIRVTPWMAGDERYDFLASKLSLKRYESMDIRILNKDVSKSAIEIGIYLVANMEDFIRYNELVEAHNDQHYAEQEGTGYDPVTGKTLSESKAVKELWPTIRTDMVEKPDLEELDVLPGVTPPRPKYMHQATILLTLEAFRGEWRMGYRVEELQNKILTSGAVIDKDLSVASQQVVHQIFGNAAIETSGDPYLGIGRLLRGGKTFRSRNPRRALMSKPGLQLYAATILEILFRYLLPTAFILIGIAVTVVGASNIHSNNVLYGMITAVVAPAVCVGISRYLFEWKGALIAEHNNL